MTSFSRVSGEITSNVADAYDRYTRARLLSVRLGYEISRRSVHGPTRSPGDRGGGLTHSCLSMYFERIFKETPKGRMKHVGGTDYRLNEHYPPPLFPLSTGICLLVFPLRVYRRLLFTAVSYLLRFIHGVIAPAISSPFRRRRRRICVFTITIFLHFFTPYDTRHVKSA